MGTTKLHTRLPLGRKSRPSASFTASMQAPSPTLEGAAARHLSNWDPPTVGTAESPSTTPPPPVPHRAAAKVAGVDAGGSMLPRYFRDMALHPVLGPSEELAAARAVEEGEIAHWIALLSSPTAAEHILASLGRSVAEDGEDEVNAPQIPEMARLVRRWMRHGRLLRTQRERYAELSRSLAEVVRLPDSDRVWMNGARQNRPQVGLRSGRRQRCDASLDAPRVTGRARKQPVALSGPGRLRRRVSSLPRPGGADLPCPAGSEEPFREGEPTARRDARAPVRPGAVPLYRPDPGGQPGPHEGRRAVRSSPGVSVFDVRLVVDPACPRAGVWPIGAAPPSARPRARRVQPRRTASAGAPRRTGREPTLGRTREFDRNAPREARDARGRARRCAPFAGSAPRVEDDRRPIDALQDEDAVSPFDEVASRAWRSRFRTVGGLTPVESRILRLRFGLDDGDEQTLQEIGDKCHVSRERIRQLQARALEKLRKQMRRTHQTDEV